MSNKSVSDQMAEILNEIGNGAEEALTTGLKSVSRTAPAKLKDRSPRKTGEYAKGWRAKKLDKHAIVVYNATMPGLTHLLENGHMIVNKKGTYGRYNGVKHIAPVDQEEQQAFFDATMNALDKEL